MSAKWSGSGNIGRSWTAFPMTNGNRERLVQSEERLLDTQEVTGSIPVSLTIDIVC